MCPEHVFVVGSPKTGATKIWPFDVAEAARRYQFSGWPAALTVLPAVLLVMGLVWLPYLPNDLGHVGADYSFWMPNLLAGYFWRLQNGIGAVAWFTPSQCGGVPFQADPQGAYFALPQFLAFVFPPVRAVQISFLAFAGAGFLSCFHLAHARFRLATPAALLAALLFAFNGLFSARMLVGHLSFSAIMLLPAAAACLLGPKPAAGRLGSWVMRCGVFAIILAAMVEGGMLVLIPPAMLSLLMVIVIHAIATDQMSLLPLWRLCTGTALGILLAAGKLAAVASLMAHIPRDLYPLPGFATVFLTVWDGVRAVFFEPGDDMPHHIVNSFLFLEPHEFNYSVGPVPLVLMLAGGLMTWRRGLPLTRARKTMWEILLVLLLIPIALNTYGIGWNWLLKMLPVIRNASSLLRWFAAYMLPAVLGAGIALERLAEIKAFRPWPVMGAATAAAMALLVFGDRSMYGPRSIIAYSPRAIEAAWHASHDTGHVPAITNISALQDATGHIDRMSLGRQDGMVVGISQLFCYDPLFGYRLENFPHGVLHIGSVFDESGPATPGGSQLNIKNPACYVFPEANSCKPGDDFLASKLDEAAAFASYKPFPWAKPGWARFADWAGCVAWPLTLLGIAGAFLLRFRRTETAAGI
jgi:hypothetical protein